MAVTIDGTNGITNVNGSATTPAETGTDTDTGIYYGTNTVSLATGGTQRFTIDSSGNVGIGTSSPGKRLSVETTSTGNQTLLTLNVPNTAGNNSAIEFSVNNAGSIIPVSKIATAYDGSNNIGLAFSTFNSGGLGERVRIDKDGNVGIGTSSPIAISNQTSCTVNGTNVGRFDVRVGGTHVAQYLATSTDVQIGSIANIPVLFYANSVERMRITSGGNVTIGGTTTSSWRLFVKGETSAATAYACVMRNSSDTNLFLVENDGLVATGTAANSPYNQTTGSAANVYVDSNGILYRSTSSLRYKSNVQDATHGLADVLKLRSVTYNAKNSGDTIFGGLIAEEVHEAGLTEFVAYDKEGQPDALHYGNMVALLTKAIQEQQQQIDALKAEFDAYKAAHP